LIEKRARSLVERWVYPRGYLPEFCQWKANFYYYFFESKNLKIKNITIKGQKFRGRKCPFRRDAHDLDEYHENISGVSRVFHWKSLRTKTGEFYLWGISTQVDKLYIPL
jgi:hypothetical protein